MPTKRTTKSVKAKASKATISVPVYGLDGKKTGEVVLDPAVFGVQVSDTLLNKAVNVQRANSRSVIAHTKTRAERRGGGRKPWKQKGTGRARQGSIRSPQWRKGGVVFGPRSNRNYSIKLNRKERRQAILGALSIMASHEAGVIVLDELTLPDVKTARVAKLLAVLPVTRKALIVLPEHDKNIELSTRNLPRVKTQLASNLNVVDLLGHRHLVLAKAALERVAATYAKAS
jgi:large subunit ribosomal protein L4